MEPNFVWRYPLLARQRMGVFCGKLCHLSSAFFVTGAEILRSAFPFGNLTIVIPKLRNYLPKQDLNPTSC
jgi:hypothetical protein